MKHNVTSVETGRHTTDGNLKLSWYWVSGAQKGVQPGRGFIPLRRWGMV